MRFAIFLREGDQTYDKVNEVPEQFRNRILAVRSFDAKAMMVANQLVDGNEIEPVIVGNSIRLASEVESGDALG